MTTLFQNPRFLSHALVLSLSLLALGAFALDMSIIDYDESHMRHMYEAWLVRHGKAYNALGRRRGGLGFLRRT
ncbi:Cysteine proteinase RD21a [Spatholobus suberectus]|nr:Cysteine proteinase RD21a [Spatholobus suberectus]